MVGSVVGDEICCELRVHVCVVHVVGRKRGGVCGLRRVVQIGDRDLARVRHLANKSSQNSVKLSKRHRTWH